MNPIFLWYQEYVLVTPLRRVDDTLLQRPLRMRHRLCRAAEPHLAADVIPASAAETARLAREPDLEGHAVPRLEGRRGASCDHDAAGLVAQRQGLTHEDVSVPVVRKVVQV